VLHVDVKDDAMTLHRFLNPAAIVVITIAASLDVRCGAQQPMKVSFEELSTRWNVVGLLGAPVGALTEIDGKWMDDANPSEKFGKTGLLVTRIDGVTPKEKIFIPRRNVVNWARAGTADEPRTGSEVTGLKVIEVVRFTGNPPNVASEPGHPIGAGMLPWTFSSVIMCVSRDDGKLRTPEKAPLVEHQRTIKVSDISKEYAIYGILNQPVGKFVWIKGTWSRDRADATSASNTRFSIFEIDGERLKSPIVVPRSSFREGDVYEKPLINPTPGKTEELRVFERIGMAITPRNASTGGDQLAKRLEGAWPWEYEITCVRAR
jgi:hypothetical protein